MLHPAGPQLDINASDARQLSTLPGLTVDDAARIVANRPYYELRDLVRNHVLDEEQYTRIKDKVYVGPPGMPEYLRGVPPGTN
jgi:DNA uptake protein ComE-like DNA-binding protein